jgi:hypothetical protein
MAALEAKATTATDRNQRRAFRMEGLHRGGEQTPYRRLAVLFAEYGRQSTPRLRDWAFAAAKIRPPS